MTTSEQHCHFTISGGSHRSLLLPHLCLSFIFNTSLPLFLISVLLHASLFLSVFVSLLSVPFLYISSSFFLISVFCLYISFICACPLALFSSIYPTSVCSLCLLYLCLSFISVLLSSLFLSFVYIYPLFVPVL
jgi:hypothetical protein